MTTWLVTNIHDNVTYIFIYYQQFKVVTNISRPFFAHKLWNRTWLISALQTYQTNQPSKKRQLNRQKLLLYIIFILFPIKVPSKIKNEPHEIFVKDMTISWKVHCCGSNKNAFMFKFSIILKTNTSRFGPNLSRQVILTYLYLSKNQEYGWY